MKMKKALLVVLLILTAVCLSACQGKNSQESKYEKAEALLAEGKYDEAVAALEGFGNYEDAAKMVLYCKAILAAEDNQYESALKTFQLLGDYRDCDLLRPYYTARKNQFTAENTDGNKGIDYISAAVIYQTIPLYKDCEERGNSCMKAAYDDACDRLGKGLTSDAEETFILLGEYEDSLSLACEARANAKYDRGDLAGAYDIYCLLDAEYQIHAADYESRYTAAAALKEEEKYEEAAAEFAVLGGYQDSKTQVSDCNYLKACVNMEEGKYDDAVSAFSLLGKYKDSQAKSKECRYLKAVKTAENGKYLTAAELFDLLGDYKDSKSLAKKARADRLYGQNKLADAWEIYKGLEAKYQTHAADYESRYTAAAALKEEKKYEEAAAAFAVLGGYSDSKTQVSDCKYLKACVNKEEGKYDDAADAFTLLGAYKDSEAQITECRYLKALSVQQSGKYDEAKVLFSRLGEYRDSQTQVTECEYLKAVKTAADGKCDEAVKLFTALGEYKDSAVLIEKAKADRLYGEGKLADAWEIYKGLDSAYQTHAQVYADRYEAAKTEMNEGNYDIARTHFLALGSYQESVSLAKKCLQDKATALETSGDYTDAISVYTQLKDTNAVNRCHYLLGMKYLAEKKYRKAAEEFRAGANYPESHMKSYEAGMQAFEAGDLKTAYEVLKEETLTDQVKESIYRIASKASEAKNYELSVKVNSFLASESYYKDSLMNSIADRYRWGNQLYEQGEYDRSAEVFADLGDFSTAPKKVQAAGYASAKACMDKKDYKKARGYLASLGNYLDSASLLKKCEYEIVAALHAEGKYGEALDAFIDKKLAGYLKSDEMISDCRYHLGLALEKTGDYPGAMDYFTACGEYKDAADHLLNCRYQYACDYLSSGDIAKAVEWFRKAGKHKETFSKLDYIAEFYDTTELTSDAEYIRQVKTEIMAENALEDGEYGKAVEYYQQITDKRIGKSRETEAYYLYAAELVGKGEYVDAVKAFTSAGDYSDAKTKIQECWMKIGEARFAAGEYESAIEAFTSAGEYTGAATKIQESWMKVGETRFAAGEYESAIEAFTLAGEYTGAGTKIQESWMKIGEARFAAGEYESAIEAFTSAGNHTGAKAKITETWNTYGEAELTAVNYAKAKECFTKSGNQDRYDATVLEEAKAEMNDGKYAEAYELLMSIETNPKAKELLNTETVFAAFRIKKGETTFFGVYEQDNDEENGREPIEWVVLEADDEKALLVSKYGLDMQPYNSGKKDITWENSSVRKWLNNDFLSSAFSENEQSRIINTYLQNSSEKRSGNDTYDRVFLLSKEEVEKYMKTGDVRRCIPTAYAIARGAKTSLQYSTAWYLRTHHPASANMIVSLDILGTVTVSTAFRTGTTIRPAIWIKLK